MIGPSAYDPEVLKANYFGESSRWVTPLDGIRAAVGKRSRAELSPEYRERYLTEILDRVDLAMLAGEVPLRTAVLFCVERDPEACHRSLIAARLADELGFEVGHLRP